MEIHLLWLVAGFALIIAELATGTFYLLVLGLAAFAGAAAAWFGLGFRPQALSAAGVAIAGVLWVRWYRSSRAQHDMASLDVGQSVTLDAWVSQEQGRARVRYRDALWDAQVSGDCSFGAGQILFIHAVDGSTLKVSIGKP
jgi:membrane protein implicated in regulation of membrane protease activity